MMLVQVGDAIFSQGLDEGFRVPNLIRFVNDESAYLSTAHGGPRMFINLEDHLSLTTGVDNSAFQVPLTLSPSAVQLLIYLLFR